MNIRTLRSLLVTEMESQDGGGRGLTMLITPEY